MFAVNIPADGLFLAILNKSEGDLSENRCLQLVREYIDRYLEAAPDIIMLNVCYRRSLTPSEVFDSYLYDIATDENGFAKIGENGKSIKTLSLVSDNVSKYFSSFFQCARELLKNHIDIYKTAVQQIRKHGCRVFLSVRMNDGHYPDNPAVNSSFAMKNGGEHTIWRDGAVLDYSQEAVRNHFCEYITELVETYDVDGIELDWLRYPTVLPYERRSEYDILNDYMKRIRRLLNGYRKNLSLAVRVLPHETDNLANGADVCQWIADGSVDIVTAENFYIPTNFEIPVEAWRESIAQKNTALNPYCFLCGTDWAVSCVEKYNIAMTPALVRGFFCECLARGADGVYLFNFFEENDTSSFELVTGHDGGVYLKNCFSERIKAAKNPYDLPRRYVHIGSSNKRYPIGIAENESYVFSSRLIKPFGRCRIIIGCDTDTELSVRFNVEQECLFTQNEAVGEKFGYIPPADIGRENEFIYAVSQAAPYVKTVTLSEAVCKNDFVEVEIRNTVPQSVAILWIELLFE